VIAVGGGALRTSHYGRNEACVLIVTRRSRFVASGFYASGGMDIIGEWASELRVEYEEAVAIMWDGLTGPERPQWIPYPDALSDDLEREIWELLAGPLTSNEIVRLTGKKRTRVLSAIRRMERLGWIWRIGTETLGAWERWDPHEPPGDLLWFAPSGRQLDEIRLRRWGLHH
jgi:hypothetical protein